MKTLIIIGTACGNVETDETVGYKDLVLVNTEILTNECQCGQGMCGWRKWTFSTTKK